MTAIDDLLENNARFAQSFEGPAVPPAPALHVAVVTCMDARMNVWKLLGLRDGEAHVIRNAGGVLTDDTIRSLSISQRSLGTTAVALVHHTGCGMLTVDEDSFKRDMEQETGVRPTWALEAFDDLETDVRESVAKIRANPFIPHKGEVRGFVYDVSTGVLTEVD
jgi:carbonic anhydrase